MLLSDLFSETYSAITVNKARSFLTILGIVIGIASVIAMISIGRGAQNSIQESIQSIGSNLLMIRPGSQGGFSQVKQGQGSAKTLTAEDADTIEREIDSVKIVAPEISGRYQIIAKGQNTNTTVAGVTSEYPEARNLKIDDGTFITSQHLKSMSKVAVLGSEVILDLFGEDFNPVGQKVRINGIDFTVVGTIVSKGGSGFGSSDDIIYIPLSTSQQFLEGNDLLSLISVTVKDQKLMTEAEKEIETLLLKEHKISNAEDSDFRIMNQADIVETASSVAGTFTTLLGAVAGISLIVGGIGIMNMMLISVTERTREIGLRKAIGAKKNNINTQFLMEAIALTFLGGIIGVLLGLAISLGVEKYAGLTTEVTLSSVLMAFGVAAGIGIIFGYYPAQRAAKLNPIEALRHE